MIIIIRTAVSVPIPMAEAAATAGGTDGVMVEVVFDMDTSTTAGLTGHGVAVAEGMDMGQGTSSAVSSHRTLGLLLLWLLWRRHLLHHHLLALLLHRHHLMGRL